MQYILSVQEYQSLTNKRESEIQIDKRDDALAFAKKTIMDLADKACIKDKHAHVRSRFMYCDECPLGSLHNNRESNRLICTDSREYSK